MCVIYKRNAFLNILEAFLRFRRENYQFDTGFIRVYATRFWLLRNLVFVSFIRFFDMAECRVRFIYKRNAFVIILKPFCVFGSKSLHFRQVL